MSRTVQVRVKSTRVIRTITERAYQLMNGKYELLDGAVSPVIQKKSVKVAPVAEIEPVVVEDGNEVVAENIDEGAHAIEPKRRGRPKATKE